LEISFKVCSRLSTRSTWELPTWCTCSLPLYSYVEHGVRRPHSNKVMVKPCLKMI
jgi:hypothetical protein